MSEKTIQSALISVFNKEGLAPIIQQMKELGIKIYSTGGTAAFAQSLGAEVISVESVTDFPSIFGGRVKTLHPKIFGGILNRQNNAQDAEQMQTYQIPQIDLVIVDLYPFEQTVAQGADPQEIIEKIDIGGVSLIRAAAKNFNDVLCVAHATSYPELLHILSQQKGKTSLNQRKKFATQAFAVTAGYDSAIFNYFNTKQNLPTLSIFQSEESPLRYGENPHQKASFFGKLSDLLEKLHGKELSYNNLLDIDAAIELIQEFSDALPTFAILKHNNACGVATRPILSQAYADALACDPISAFGGILICNQSIDIQTATQINSLFCEVVIAPDFEPEALQILQSKKNRVLLRLKKYALPKNKVRSCLNGFLVQQKDLHTDTQEDLQFVTQKHPDAQQISDLLFASKICKHTKSNAIVLAKNGQLLASGVGQTSRVDALKQAIEKAKNFGFSLQGATMASDAFFPFPDCVEIAHNEGINTVIQPGGSVKDQESINFCNQNGVAMVFTGVRHFKH